MPALFNPAKAVEPPQPGVYYGVEDVPYERMWADDRIWMPTLLASDASYFEGHFVFDGPPGPDSRVVSHNWRALPRG